MVEFIDKPIQRKTAVTGNSATGSPAAPALKHTVNISGYTIISKLGESNSSTVWKAKQESLNRMVAIKVLKKKSATDQADVEGFISEAKMLAKLKSPHTIQIYDIGNLDDTFYLVMEYLDRQTLKELLHKKGYLPQKEALNIAAAVVDALDEAWNTGKFYHGHLKPDNIMLEKDGSIKLSNLGLSRMLNAHNAVSDSGEVPYYISPEQAHGDKNIDFRSDMYSLGALLYHMVTGKPPFAGKSKEEIMSAHNSEQIA
jgi:serine/threonine-protein kinase